MSIFPKVDSRKFIKVNFSTTNFSEAVKCQFKKKMSQNPLNFKKIVDANKFQFSYKFSLRICQVF